jgi:hypothetical protein
MANRSKQKGSRFESAIVKLLCAAGFTASKVPLSGALGGDYSDDIKLKWFDGETARMECKARAKGGGFAQLYTWLGRCDGLFLRADRQPPLVVLRMEDFLDLMRRAHASEKTQRPKWLSASADPDTKGIHDTTPSGGCL